MIRNKTKHKAILQASKRLLLTNLMCWNVVEEILSDLYDTAKASGMKYRNQIQEKPVNQYDRKDTFIDRYDSITETMEILEISRSALNRNLRGKSKICHGFIFKYANKQKYEEAKRRKVES